MADRPVAAAGQDSDDHDVERQRAGYQLETDAKDAVNLGEDSPLDLLAEALWSVVGDTVHSAIRADNFQALLREHRLAVVPLCDGVPEPPLQWLEDALDLMGYHGQVHDVVNHAHDLWVSAWQAGHHAHHADPGEVPRDGN